MNKDYITAISEKFNIRKESVKAIVSVYDEITENINNEYLAHFIRCVERYVRIKLGNVKFQILCFPTEDPNAMADFATAHYFEKKAYFIYFYKGLDTVQIRNFIAHELGHLAIEIATSELKEEVEPLSSIFGTLIMLHKNEFYKNPHTELIKTDWHQILQEFKDLQGRNIKRTKS